MLLSQNAIQSKFYQMTFIEMTHLVKMPLSQDYNKRSLMFVGKVRSLP